MKEDSAAHNYQPTEAMVIKLNINQLSGQEGQEK
jgi:hypothetical protein